MEAVSDATMEVDSSSEAIAASSAVMEVVEPEESVEEARHYMRHPCPGAPSTENSPTLARLLGEGTGTAADSSIPESIHHLDRLIQSHLNNPATSEEERKQLEMGRSALLRDGTVVTEIVAEADEGATTPAYVTNQEQLRQKLSKILTNPDNSLVPVRVTTDGDAVLYPEVVVNGNQTRVEQFCTRADFDKYPFLKRVWHAAAGEGMAEGELVHDYAINNKGSQKRFALVAMNRMFFHTSSRFHIQKGKTHLMENHQIPIVSLFFTMPSSVMNEHWGKYKLPMRGDPTNPNDRVAAGAELTVWADHATMQLVSGYWVEACVPAWERENNRASVMCLIFAADLNADLQHVPLEQTRPDMCAKAVMARELKTDVNNYLQGALEEARIRGIDSESIGYDFQKFMFEKKAKEISILYQQKKMEADAAAIAAASSTDSAVSPTTPPPDVATDHSTATINTVVASTPAVVQKKNARRKKMRRMR